MRLRHKILSAGIWTLGAYGVELALRLVSNVIMTRLLFPEAFGLVAAASSIILGLALISDFGVHAIIVQSKRGEHQDFLRSAWVFQISRGLILWFILVFFCGFVSSQGVRRLLPVQSVFANELFPTLTIALGFGLVLSSLESTSIFLNLRRLNFKTVIIVDLVGKLISIVVMIAWAVVFPSAWALVIGALSSGAVRVALSHFIIPGPKMAYTWNKDDIKEIVHFGRWVTVSSIATFIGTQADVVMLGLLIPSSLLGSYFLAKNLVDAVFGLLGKLNNSLTLSVLGEVHRTNPAGLRDRYYKFRMPFELVAMSCAGLFLVGGNQIVGVLYDARYSDAGPMLQLLGLGLAGYPVLIITSAFTVIGKTRIGAVVSIVQAFGLVTFLIIGYLIFGQLGAVAGIGASRLLPAVAVLFLAHREKWISGWRELRIIPLFVVSILASEVLVPLWDRYAPALRKISLRELLSFVTF